MSELQAAVERLRLMLDGSHSMTLEGRAADVKAVRTVLDALDAMQPVVEAVEAWTQNRLWDTQLERAVATYRATQQGAEK